MIWLHYVWPRLHVAVLVDLPRVGLALRCTGQPIASPGSALLLFFTPYRYTVTFTAHVHHRPDRGYAVVALAVRLICLPGFSPVVPVWRTTTVIYLGCATDCRCYTDRLRVVAVIGGCRTFPVTFVTHAMPPPHVLLRCCPVPSGCYLIC